MAPERTKEIDKDTNEHQQQINKSTTPSCSFVESKSTLLLWPMIHLYFPVQERDSGSESESDSESQWDSV